MSVLTNVTVLQQAVKNVISILEGEVPTTIIDPRPTAKRIQGLEFIRPTRARSKQLYPHIVVEASIANEDTLSLVGDSSVKEIMIEIIFVTNNRKDLDVLPDQVAEVIRDNRVAFRALLMRRMKNLSSGTSPLREGQNTRSVDQYWYERTATYFFKYYAQ